MKEKKPRLAEAKKRIKEAKEKQLSGLDLSKLNLTAIPGAVFELTDLHVLDLNHNHLTELPREIAHLMNLKDLNLNSNRLTGLPGEIFQLTGLELLELGGNPFNQLPAGIVQLKNLKALWLWGHNLAEFPRDIFKLKNLHALNLSSNKFTLLPKDIAELKELRKLYLNDNLLTQLPKEITQLESLTYLYLGLEGNESLISPPPAVVKQGLHAIFKYLKALEERTTVWSSKMVLVGEGGVGKICLLDALEDKEFVAGKDTTHGIDTRKLILPCPGRPDISMELNVWDFGGQEIYHATHQFYLTNHALFILVWSARLGYEAGKIYKWLETIEALAPDSPILIAATHCKERGADLPKGDIKNKYPGKVHFFEVDNENKQGIPQLMEAICQFASQLKYMGIDRPLSWINASSAIKNLKKKYLPKNQFLPTT